MWWVIVILLPQGWGWGCHGVGSLKCGFGAVVDEVVGLEAQSPDYQKGSGWREGGVWAKSVHEILTVEGVV